MSHLHDFIPVTPLFRGVRWGVTASEAQRAYPGDQPVSTPRWEWTHALAESVGSVMDRRMLLGI